LPVTLSPLAAARALLPALLPLACLGVGCANTSEERQLADMRAEIDRIQERRDKEDEAELPYGVSKDETGDSLPAAPTLPPTSAPSVQAVPAEQDSVTLGEGRDVAPATSGAMNGAIAMSDESGDTEDPTPRPNIRVFGSSRAVRGGWREDQVEQTSPDDGPRTAGPLDPAAPPAYDAAMALVNAHQYDRAIDAFAAFLVRWPDHPYANNAMYWRGECYFAKGDYARAADQFEGVVARFPAGAKAPDAQLKLGMTRLKLGQPAKAKEAFDRLAQIYPQSDAARRIPVVPVPSTTRAPSSEDRR
jgi:tol-pal system protein YbgF